MKKKSKLSLAIAALAIAGVLEGRVLAISTDQLDQIKAFVEANDSEGLRNFLLLYPELLEEGTVLSEALVEFLSSPQGNTLAQVGFRPPMTQLALVTDDLGITSIY